MSTRHLAILGSLLAIGLLAATAEAAPPSHFRPNFVPHFLPHSVPQLPTTPYQIRTQYTVQNPFIPGGNLTAFATRTYLPGTVANNPFMRRTMHPQAVFPTTTVGGTTNNPFNHDRRLRNLNNAVTNYYTTLARYDRSLVNYNQSLTNYDRAVVHFDHALLRSEINHGINPFGTYWPGMNFPYSYNPYLSSYTNPFLNNPYASTVPATSFNPYSYATTPYGGGGGYGGGYPYSGGGYGGGGSDTDNFTINSNLGSPSSGYANAAPAAGNNNNGNNNGVNAPAANAPKGGGQIDPLAAFGIPSDNGSVQLPLAFRALATDKQRETVKKLTAQLEILATQGVIGKANPFLAKEALSNVEQLRTWLRGREGEMAAGTYRDADVFLRKVEDALATLKG